MKIFRVTSNGRGGAILRLSHRGLRSPCPRPLWVPPSSLLLRGQLEAPLRRVRVPRGPPAPPSGPVSGEGVGLKPPGGTHRPWDSPLAGGSPCVSAAAPCSAARVPTCWVPPSWLTRAGPSINSSTTIPRPSRRQIPVCAQLCAVPRSLLSGAEPGRAPTAPALSHVSSPASRPGREGFSPGVSRQAPRGWGRRGRAQWAGETLSPATLRLWEQALEELCVALSKGPLRQRLPVPLTAQPGGWTPPQGR